MSNQKLAIPSFIYSFFSFVSRLSGYIRDLVLASFIGTSVISDIFLIALKLPNSFRQSLSDETFNSAFIPIFGRIKEVEGGKQAINFTANILMLFLIFFSIVVLFVEIYMAEILYVFSSNIGDGHNFDLLVYVSRVIFPYLIVLAVSAVILGNLNAHNKFALSGAFPSLLNLVLVLAISSFGYFNGDKIIYLAYSVVIGGIFQLVVLIFNLKRDYWVSLFKISLNPLKIKEFFSLYFPVLLASTFFQINIMTGVLISSFEEGAVSYIYYAERLFYLPISIVGAAIGIVLVPNLSESIRNKDRETALGYLSAANKYALIIILPASAFLLSLSSEIVSFLFERGEFGENSSRNTTLALNTFLIGLPAVTLVKIFTPYFFAIEQPKIYLRAAFYSNCMNLILMVVLFNIYGFIGIPIAYSLSAYALLFIIIYEQKKIGLFIYNFKESLQVIKYSLMAASIFVVCNLSKDITSTFFIGDLISIVISGVSSVIIFLIFIFLFEKNILNSIRKVFIDKFFHKPG